MTASDRIRVDPNGVTWKEARMFRAMTGMSIGKMFSGGEDNDPEEESLAALCLVVIRRTRPECTLDEVMDMPVGAFTFGAEDLESSDEGGDVADPEGGSGETPPPDSTETTSNSFSN